jgi:hypothetical protein
MTTIKKQDGRKDNGGFRPGAGRPRRAYPKRILSVKLEPEVLLAFKAKCKKLGMTQEAAVTQWALQGSSEEPAFGECCDECQKPATHKRADGSAIAHLFCDKCWVSHIDICGNQGRPYSV